MEVQNALCFLNCYYTRALVIVSLSSYFSSPERAFPGGDLWAAFPRLLGRNCGFRAWLLVRDTDPRALVGSSAYLEISYLSARKAPHLGDGCG